MAYTVLARKWRPKCFKDLVGQEHVVGALLNALKQGRLHHAYLLTGTRGVGKTTIARILAKSLNCENPHDGEPCGECLPCAQIDSGRFVDLLEIDAASNTGIDNIREVLENAQYMPTSGKYKVFIIDEVHMLSKSAFNAMLKTLEEPPEHVKFILATTDPNKVPITVLSRCLQFVLRNMTVSQIAEHMRFVLSQEHIPFEEATLSLLGRAAAGSMRDALSLLDQTIALGGGQVTEAHVRQMLGVVDRQYLFVLLKAIGEQDNALVLHTIQEMLSRAVGFATVLDELAVLLQELALFKAMPDALDTQHQDKDALSELGTYLSSEEIQLYYQCVIHGKDDLSLAPDEYSGFLMTVLRMLTFSPLAAHDVPATGSVMGSELTDPYSEKAIEQAQKKTALTASDKGQADAQIETAVLAPSAETLTESVPEPKPQALPTLNLGMDVTGTKDKKDVYPSAESEPIVETSETPPVAHIQSIEPIDVAEDKTEPKDMPFEGVIQAEKQETQLLRATIYEEEATDLLPQNISDNGPSELDANAIDAEILTEAVSDNMHLTPSALVLPPLTQSNWMAIVDGLTEELGATLFFARQTAFVSLEHNILSLAHDGAQSHLTGQNDISDLGAILQKHYGIEPKIKMMPWEKTFLSARENKKQQEEATLQLAKDTLKQDPQAQKVIDLFDGEWLEDTIQLITHDKE